MESGIGFLILILIIIGVAAAMRRMNPPLVAYKDEPVPDDSPGAPPDVTQPGDSDEAAVQWLKRLYGAHALMLNQPRTARPEDLRALHEFRALVGIFSDPAVPIGTLVEYVLSDDALMAWSALVALEARPRDPELEERLIARLNHWNPWTRSFMLRVLEVWNPDDPRLAVRILRTLDESWVNAESGIVLEAHLRRRAAVGPILPDDDEDDDGAVDLLLNADVLRRTLAFVDPAIANPLFDRLPDTVMPPASGPAPPGSPQIPSGLDEIGRLTRPGRYEAGDVIATPSGDAALESVIATLTAGSPRSVLVVGESGVGKTALARRVAARLSSEGWTLFEAGAPQLNAGATFVGSLEQRLDAVRRQLGHMDKALWICPDFHQLLWSGRHVSSPTGALEMLMPAFESGDILVLGETRGAALDRLITDRPELSRLFEIVRVEPPPESELAVLIDTWAEQARGRRVDVPPSIRSEAIALARQYLSTQSPPGRVLRVLEGALARAARRVSGEAGATLGMDDLIETLAQLTGLPLAVLDDRRTLDLEEVRRRFEARVIGQPDAVRCLVDRLALLKAGVTDPARPTGVFLFAGGSGTGKTEMAKTLAEYLFDSPDRLLRLDMSELQDAWALERLTGTAREPAAVTTGVAGGSLAERVRRQPFSVVLLDEFEKAHPRVWDVFLQVFDDGRLTDQRGETADFRHAIIILTSNLGIAGDGSPKLGMVGEGAGFSPAGVRRAVERTFRPEFLNRLDDIVVFRPLTRDVMRQILRKELTEAFDRRGLRRRDWAIELEESAIDLLIERGFSPTFGARPLRRALERLLLTPLAAAIVDRRAPEGGQFLFVRADGDGLAVTFVDPDAEGAGAVMMGASEEAAFTRDLAAIVFEPHGSAAEIELLQGVLTGLRDAVEAEAWQSAKEALLLEMAAPGFWERDDRFEPLGRAEYMDRVESGVRSASSLLDRLERPSSVARNGYPRHMVGRLAQQLFLLQTARAEALDCGPRDAFVAVEPLHEEPSAPGAAGAFATRLFAMYEAWARARGMRLTPLPGGTGPEAEQQALAVSGFAAYAILEAENGLHVLETGDDGDRSARRVTVRVRVARQPVRPPRDGAAGLARQADEALAAQPASTFVVRRYREKPSPLVRDAVRGWRTGRIERVLGGDFDVVPAREAG